MSTPTHSQERRSVTVESSGFARWTCVMAPIGTVFHHGLDLIPHGWPPNNPPWRWRGSEPKACPWQRWRDSRKEVALYLRRRISRSLSLPAPPRQSCAGRYREASEPCLSGTKTFFATRLEYGWAARKRAPHHRDVGAGVHFEDKRVPVDVHLHVASVLSPRRDGV
ncbi:hypothetical protein MRX96_021169 [Rhipicephalus microplus]